MTVRQHDRTEQQGSTAAKVLYRPVGLAGSIIGGIVAGALFKQVWKRAAVGSDGDAPKALESEYPVREVLLAAALPGRAVRGRQGGDRPRRGAGVRALDRRVARRLTGRTPLRPQDAHVLTLDRGRALA